MPSANHSLKYLYGRAFRAPNAYELYYYRDASAYLQPESIDTHEWVWEAYFGERVRTAVSTYRYKASQLVDLQIVDPGRGRRLGFANAGTIRATGLELESEIRLKRGAQALASYALQDAKDAATGGLRLTNSPRHMAKLRLSVPGPLRSLVRVVRVAVPEQPDDHRGHRPSTLRRRERDHQRADWTLGDGHRTGSQPVQRTLRRPCLGRTPGRFDRTERADGPRRSSMGVLESQVTRVRTADVSSPPS